MQQSVPYTSDGVIDWGQLEDDLASPESDDDFECDVASLDWTRSLPSNIHPYHHNHPGEQRSEMGSRPKEEQADREPDRPRGDGGEGRAESGRLRP